MDDSGDNMHTLAGEKGGRTASGTVIDRKRQENAVDWLFGEDITDEDGLDVALACAAVSPMIQGTQSSASMGGAHSATALQEECVVAMSRPRLPKSASTNASPRALTGKGAGVRGLRRWNERKGIACAPCALFCPARPLVVCGMSADCRHFRDPRVLYWSSES